MAMAQVLFAEDLADVGALAGHLEGLDEVQALVADFTPEAVAPACGIGAEQIRRLARELAGAERAAVYGRIGTTTQSFGTLTSWLVDVLNVLTGTSTARAVPCSRGRPPASATRSAVSGQGPRASPSTAGRRGSAGCPRRWASCRCRRWPRRSTRPARASIRALMTQAGNPLSPHPTPTG